jgi:hypothetical protein
MFDKLSFQRRCPVCHCLSIRRTGRKRWMGILPWSKRYYCEDCGASFWVVIP